MKAIGIVLAGGNNRMMRELTNKRAIASDLVICRILISRMLQ